jgi:sugar transferase (PEP-CTERM/EpsH1 system associated)
MGLDSEAFEQIVCAIKGGFEWTNMEAGRLVSLNGKRGKSSFLVPHLVRVFERERPHVVHSRNWAAIEAIPAARLARVPAAIHSEHGRDLQDLGQSPWRRRSLRRLCYRWADRVFTVSQALKDYYVSDLGIPATRLEVIPNGVDAQRFRPDAAARKEMRGRLGIADRTVVVGTLGRLDPIKDHPTLFRAAEKCIAEGLDIRVLVVGDGSARPVLERELNAIPTLLGRTAFTGEVINVADWLNAFDIYVLPSLAEGMSNTLLEAMAAGVPVVATRVGGNCEVIENGRSGLLFETQDVEALVIHLKGLVENGEWRQRLGIGGRERVEQYFSIQFMLNRYSNMYRDISDKVAQIRPSQF